MRLQDVQYPYTTYSLRRELGPDERTWQEGDVRYWVVDESVLELEFIHQQTNVMVEYQTGRQLRLDGQFHVRVNRGISAQSLDSLTWDVTNGTKSKRGKLKTNSRVESRERCAKSGGWEIKWRVEFCMDDLEPGGEYELYYSLKEDGRTLCKYISLLPKIQMPRMTVEVMPEGRMIGNGVYSVRVRVNDDEFEQRVNNVELRDAYTHQVQEMHSRRAVCDRVGRKSGGLTEYVLKREVTNLRHGGMVYAVVQYGENEEKASARYQRCVTNVESSELEYTVKLNEIHLKFAKKQKDNQVCVRGVSWSFGPEWLTSDTYVVCKTIHDLQADTIYIMKYRDTDPVGNHSEWKRVCIRTPQYVVQRGTCTSEHPYCLIRGCTLRNLYFECNYEVTHLNIVLKADGCTYYEWKDVKYDQQKGVCHVKDELRIKDGGEYLLPSSTVGVWAYTNRGHFYLKKSFYFNTSAVICPKGELMLHPREVQSTEMVVQILGYKDELDLPLDYECSISNVQVNGSFRREHGTSQRYVSIHDKTYTCTGLLPDTRYQVLYRIRSLMNKKQQYKDNCGILTRTSFEFVTKTDPDYGVLYIRKPGNVHPKVTVQWVGEGGQRRHRTLGVQEAIHEEELLRRESLLIIKSAGKTYCLKTIPNVHHYVLELDKGTCTTEFVYRFYGFHVHHQSGDIQMYTRTLQTRYCRL